MSLVIWLPFTEGLDNQGLQHTTFSGVSSCNAAINSAGKIGKCYTSSAGAIVSSAKVNLGTNVSMFAWIKPTSVSGYQGICGQYRGGDPSSTSSSTGIAFGLNGSGLRVTIGSTAAASSGVTISAGVWTHVGFTYSASSKKVSFYVNGVFVSETSNISYSAPNDYVLVFGSAFKTSTATDTSSHAKIFNGALNDVRIFDHCCSTKEAKEMSLGIVLHYKFDDETILRSTMYDCSGYRNNGTVTGTLPSSTDSGRYSRALSFPNTAAGTNFITVNTASSICPALTNCTVAWWAKCNSVQSLLLTGQTTSYYLMASDSSKAFYHSNVGGTPTYYVDGLAVTTDATRHYTAGEWHHYAITGISLSSWTNILVNNYGNGTTWCINGLVNDLRIYSTKLSADDIKSLARTMAAVDDKGAIHTYEFIEC